jgi:ribosomal protein S18 acetylase RimI-like enzyme
MDISQRKASKEDVGFVTDVFLRAMHIPIAAARGFWDEAKERTQFVDQLDISQTEIIRQGDSDVGFMLVLDRGHDREIHTLCIAPEFQSGGIGRQVTLQLLDHAAKHNHDVVLSVLKSNRGAQSFYEQLNFVVTEESSYHRRMRFSPR